ncbi:calcium homeostasis modulator protein 5 [Pelobates fuscus]|uniref:calcium homeostasis modulator protein 5 n=1 Tax=Pelobates fuscus TaxID=191477 RepID=UPI002FE4724D
MDGLHKFVLFFTEKKSAIVYGFLALMTVGGQQLFSLVAFKCPCSHQNLIYGCVFLFAPALILLVIAYFLDNRTWKLYTGCCLNPKKMFPTGNSFYCFFVSLHLTANAFIVPVMWIAIALLNGTFYACAMSGWQNPEFVQFLCNNKSSNCPRDLFKVTCGNTSMPATDSIEIARILQAQSQVLGWWLITVTSVASLLLTCYVNCRSKVSSLQTTFWRIYMGKEKEKFDQLAQEYATKLAERNIRSFFENKEPEVFEMPDNKSWEEVSSLYYSLNTTHQYYSTLHRFVERADKVSRSSSEEIITSADGEQEII